MNQSRQQFAPEVLRPLSAWGFLSSRQVTCRGFTKRVKLSEQEWTSDSTIHDRLGGSEQCQQGSSCTQGVRFERFQVNAEHLVMKYSHKPLKEMTYNALQDMMWLVDSGTGEKSLQLPHPCTLYLTCCPHLSGGNCHDVLHVPNSAGQGCALNY